VNWAAIISLLAGLIMTWLFLYGLVTPLQGPVARALNGLDLSWLAGMLTGGLLYYTLYKLGMATPRAGAREEAGESSQVNRNTEA
jgi:nucleobase:cation symporter-1, NCS1 family